MVDEILRILDRSAFFTIIFIFVDIIKIVFSCLVLYFFGLELQNTQYKSWLCLVLFIVQNFIEVAYCFTKFIHIIIIKQKKVLKMFFSGKEITFNPYEITKKERILEIIYYTITL